MNSKRLVFAILTMVFVVSTSAVAQTWSQDGPWAGGFKQLFWDPTDTTHVVSWGCSSQDGGESWTATEPPLDISEPNDYTICFAEGDFSRTFLLHNNRLYRSVDAEDDWVDVTDALFTGEPVLLDIVAAESGDGNLYVLAKNSFEVLIYVSTDHGSSFSLLSLFSTLAYNGMIRVDPGNSDRILAATESWSAYSSDGGANWTENYLVHGEGGGSFYSMVDIEFDPVRPENIYVSEDLWTFSITYQTVNGVFDESTCWTISAWSINVDPVEGTLYASISDETNPGGTFRSDDGGDTWTRIGRFASLPISWDIGLPYRFSLALHPSNPNRVLMFDRVELFASEDRGDTGMLTGRGLGYANITDLMPDPADPEKALALTNMQQYWVPDEELGWSALLNRGVKRFAPNPDSETPFYLSGHYIYEADDDGRSVSSQTEFNYGDWYVSVVPGSPGGLVRWVQISEPSVLEASSDGGETWMATLEQPDQAHNLVPDPHVDGRIWTSGRGLLHSDDGGQTWVVGDDTYPFSEAIVPEIGTGGVYGYFHPTPTVPFLLFSRNLGQTIQELSYPEEITHIYDMKRRPGTSRQLFLATDQGVYWTDDRGDTWTYLEGPYTTPCTALAFTEDGTGLHIGTEADGIWTGLDLFVLMDVASDSEVLPTTITLHPAWPNPFNASTRVAYDLPRAGQVQVTVYDLLGRRVALLEKGLRSAGHHEVTWKANATSGTYIVRLQSGAVDRAQKVMLVR